MATPRACVCTASCWVFLMTVDGSCDEPVGGRGEIVSAKKKKKEQNELAMSSQTCPVTHLAGPPTSQVPP